MSDNSWRPKPGTGVGTTLETFVLEGMFESPGATGNLTSLLNQITLAAKLINTKVRSAGLANALGLTGDLNVHGESVQRLDVIANDTIVESLRRRGHCAALASEEMSEPVIYPDSTGHYLVVADPLDGSSNIDVNISIGTIFGILRYDRSSGQLPTAASFLRPGRELVAAGYVIYGSSTQLVMTRGQSVHGFTWDPSAGEFFLSHDNIRCPERGETYSINEGNGRRWSEGVQRWNEHIKGKTGGPSHSQRYVGSLVADAHRTLLRGGIFAYPADAKNPEGKLRLLYEANPFAKIFEAAGGVASTGTERVLDLQPTSLHQRVPLVLGSREQVADYQRLVHG